MLKYPLPNPPPQAGEGAHHRCRNDRVSFSSFLHPFTTPDIPRPSPLRIPLLKDAAIVPTIRRALRNRSVPPERGLSMQLYLPIADLPVNVFLVLAMGAAVGFVSGMFGIGGGFLMTPLLIFIGITPAVAVASVASHIAASSFSGALSYWRRRAIDPALAGVLLSGGVTGTALGVWTFTQLRALGQLDLMIALSYVVLLTTVGSLMFSEGLRALMRTRRGALPPRRTHNWIHGLPLKMRFKRSKIYLSVIPVVIVGIMIGFIGAIMGIGGGFILVPIMIYLLRVPTSTVIGTSMVLTLVTMLFATMLHAVTNHLVDAVLALILMVGGVTGAQFGVRAGQKIRGEQLRLLLGLLILSVGIRFAVELVIQPSDLFTIRELGASG
uniref:Probable membrane transporter protein n=2 Tax=Bradyrhizobium amphicarpaeae TaxID=1404768 RepID=A0A2U8PMI5_9BRAD|nr:sulfite exporter TauE/SafE family protein [Bradyrhizobium amphicarpaeae]